MAEKDFQKRNMMFIGGVLVIIVGAVVVYTYKNSNEKVSDGAANVAAVPSISAVPATSDSEDYNKSIREFNDKSAEKALDDGSSYVPTLTSDTSLQTINPLDLLEKPLEEVPNEAEELEKIQEIERETLMPTIDIPQETLVPPTANVQQQQVAIAPVLPPPAYGQQDFIVLEALLGINSVVRPQTEFDYKRNAEYMNAEKEATAQAYQNLQVNNAAANNNEEFVAQLKAGDMMQAILETDVNSKEPSAVMAKVIGGKFAGARLIGSIQVVGKKVVLQFSTINIPGHNKSYAISAVAVDLNTSRTAMASEVNNHYFLKYGLLLGSAFIKGWSEAIKSQNQTTQMSENGTITVQTGEKSNKEINREALGEVGTEISSAVRSSQSSLDPTIKVYKDTAIGLLLLSDFSFK